jgi:hypothetical protein
MVEVLREAHDAEELPGLERDMLRKRVQEAHPGLLIGTFHDLLQSALQSGQQRRGDRAASIIQEVRDTASGGMLLCLRVRPAGQQRATRQPFTTTSIYCFAPSP